MLYIGVTNNLQRRVYEHKHKLNSGYTEKYNINKLVYYETFTDINVAIAREKQLKNWRREWKFNLVKSKNLNMNELADEFGEVISDCCVESL